jgi:aldehyde dehydrogenase (NAD+)
MKTFNRIYINGRFVTPHGTETLTLVDPATEEPASIVTLADVEDTRAAIGAAKTAYAEYRNSTLAERGAYLQRLHDAVTARMDEHVEAIVAEYGGTRAFARASAQRTADNFLRTKKTMEEFAFTRRIGRATVHMDSLGVVGIITPWNASSSFVASKLAMALAVGSTTVIKPSELSAWQTQILVECLHAADLPPGLFNIVTGRGEVVGAEITRHPDIAKISFTGSGAVGKTIARDAAATLKRLTLELGGKSANILLDDANFEDAIPLALRIAYMNNGQACLAGTRLLVPAKRLDEAKRLLTREVSGWKVGGPGIEDTMIGPMVTKQQYHRVEGYIRSGIEEGAELLAGGEGRPADLARGYFVKPTIFVGVKPEMRIAREEIFGPVLSVLTYDTEDEAARIANDTSYGLHAYVSSGDPTRARRMADRTVAGRVFINGMYDEPDAPFGGFKESGLGREYGAFGMEGYVEPRTVVG